MIWGKPVSSQEMNSFRPAQHDNSLQTNDSLHRKCLGKLWFEPSIFLRWCHWQWINISLGTEQTKKHWLNQSWRKSLVILKYYLTERQRVYGDFANRSHAQRTPFKAFMNPYVWYSHVSASVSYINITSSRIVEWFKAEQIKSQSW